MEQDMPALAEAALALLARPEGERLIPARLAVRASTAPRGAAGALTTYAASATLPA
jgi:hypothetical protein